MASVPDLAGHQPALCVAQRQSVHIGTGFWDEQLGLQRLRSGTSKISLGPLTTPSKKRYDDTANPVIFSRFSETTKYMRVAKVQERDRIGCIRYFFNGWHSARRYQGRTNGKGTGDCAFCEPLADELPVAAVGLSSPEDSNDHACDCSALTYCAKSMNLIDEGATSWWNEWLNGRFGTTRNADTSADREANDIRRISEFIQWTGALYSLHNIARHSRKGSLWKSLDELKQYIFHVMDDSAGASNKKSKRIYHGPPAQAGPERARSASSAPPFVPNRRPFASTGVT